MIRNKAVLMSMKPQFASRILDGSKTVELRRRMLRVKAGDVIALYVSSPVKKLVATLEILGVQSDEPNSLWEVVSPRAALSRREYDDYFEGAKLAVGILIGDIRRCPRPLPLSKLREVIQGFTVPQSFRYLCDAERAALDV